MKNGDIVARAYMWPELISGIVIDRHEEQVNIDPESAESFSCSQATLTIAWADGSISHELDIEIEYFEYIIDDQKRLREQHVGVLHRLTRQVAES